MATGAPVHVAHTYTTQVIRPANSSYVVVSKPLSSHGIGVVRRPSYDLLAIWDIFDFQVIMPRRCRRLLALPSIALATFAPTLLAAAKVGPSTSSLHASFHSQRHAESNGPLHQQPRRKATLCDSACPDDPTYLSKIGLACADHGQFQCPMFLILGYNEDETAELIRRCVSLLFVAAW